MDKIDFILKKSRHLAVLLLLPPTGHSREVEVPAEPLATPGARGKVFKYSLGLGNRACKNLTIHFLPQDSRDRHRAVQPDHRQLPLCRAGLLDPERRLQHHVLRDGRQGIPLVVPPVARHIHLPGMYSRLVKKNKGWNGTEKTVSKFPDETTTLACLVAVRT